MTTDEVRAVPKDKPIINTVLLEAIAHLIHECEWPEENKSHHCAGDIQTAHIRARGMGGGRRQDTPSNLVRLCAFHHAHFDNWMGQSFDNQAWLRINTVDKRPGYIKVMLDEAYRKGDAE